MKRYEELETKVIEWGRAKGILDNSDPLRQLEKTQEELNETMLALIALRNMDHPVLGEELTLAREHILTEVKDGIGDMQVTIILLAELAGFNLVDCLGHSYDIISKRTGKMVNGFFVKDK